MSAGEKRFFNLFTNRYAKTKSSKQLFDILQSFDAWDSIKIHKTIKKQKIDSNLSVLVTLLANEITNSLRIHNETNIIDFEINQYIEEVKMLSKKNILGMTDFKLKKAERLAKGADKHEKLLEICLLKRTLGVKNLTNENANKLNKKISAERLELLAIIENKEQYTILSQEIYYLFRKYGYPKSDAEKIEFEDIINHPLLKDSSEALSVSAINSYYFIHTLYHISYNQLELAFKISKDHLDLLESESTYLKNNVGQYISVLNNTIHINSEMQNNEMFHLYIDKLRKISDTFKINDKYFEKRIFETSYALELDYYLQTSQLEKLNKLSLYLENKIEQLSKKGLSKDKFVSFSFSISVNFHYQGNYNKAHDILSKLMSVDDKKSNLKWFYYSKILELLVHYELKNYKFLMNRIVSVKRFLKINNLLSSLDLAFLKLLHTAPTSYDSTKEFKKFIKILEEHPSDTTKKLYTLYLKIDKWCHSKINSTSFQEKLF